MPITQKLKILHLEDIPTDAELIDRALSRSGLLFEKLVIDNKEDYIRALTEFKPDIILSDHSLPSFNSVEALKLLQERYLRIPFILITATISEEFAVDIMKAGATDYILKDRTQRLPSAIINALEKFRLLQEHERAIAQQAAILNALSPNITLLNEDGKIIAVNESWKKSAIQNNLGMPNYGVGYSYIAIAEKANAVDQDTAAAMATGIRSVINGVKPAFILEYVSNIGGKHKWFQLVVEPLADKNEKGAVIIHIDITDRKTAQQSVLQSEANLKTIFENTDLSIILLDPDLRIVSFNSAANRASLKLFEKKIKAGSKINSYLPTARRSLLKNIIQRVNAGETVNYETSYIDTLGTARWYEVRWVKILNSNKENSGMILSAKDITEKKKHEKQSAVVIADLIQRNKDLEQFAYTVSHNLRAAVANISGLLNPHTFRPDSKEGIETLEALTASVNNLDKTIADLNNGIQIAGQ